MATIERRRVIAGTAQTSFLCAGDPGADPVVLLHDGAWGGSAEGSWRGVIGQLAERYRVIAPDLYGYGQSSKLVQLDVAPYEFRLQQVADLLDVIGLRDRTVHLIGNSFGGAMALRATTLPWFAWRVRSAVSIAGTGGPYRTDKSLDALSHFDGTRADMLRIVHLLTGDFDGIANHVDLRMETAGHPAHYRAVAAAGIVTPFTGTAKDADPYPSNLRHVTVPLALVSGLKDDLVEHDWAPRIAEFAPLCAVHHIDARHSPNISDPGATAELLLRILADHEKPASTPGPAAHVGNRIEAPR